jgi:SNF2 family DNA or RNA helicase
VGEFYSLLALCEYNPKLQNVSKFLDKFPSQAHFADYFSYRREYEIPIRNRRVKIVKWDGIRNEVELESYLKNKYIRFGPEYLGLDPVIYSDIMISDTEDLELLEEFERWQENESVAPDHKAKAALDKAPITAKIVKSKLDEGFGPIIIFTDHRASAEALAKLLESPYIDGQTSMTTRWNYANGFQNGEYQCLVATVGSFSTGVNLTASNCMVFNDYPWVPGDLDQAIYRINRLGQTKQCHIIRVLGSPQDKAILKAVEDKRAVINKVVK